MSTPEVHAMAPVATDGPAPAAFAMGLATQSREVSLDALPVEGAIPPWLEGTLLRNGPARFETGTQRYRHWFDGQAMVHRFGISGGAVSYANRFLRTPGALASLAAGRITHAEFATDPCRTIFQRVFTQFGRPASSGNANVSVLPLGGRALALTETPLPIEFDPETLATLGVVDPPGRPDAQVTTAHPHQDPDSGDLVNYALHFARKSRYTIYRQGRDCAQRAVATLPVARPSYMHSFALAGGCAVLTEFPLRVNPISLLLSGKPFIANYRWQPRHGTRITVVDLTDGRVRGVYQAPPLFAFHHINAFIDESDILYIDLCAYPDSSIIDALYLDRLRYDGDVPRARPTRITVNLADGGVQVRRLSETPLELPRIDYPRCNARSYRWVFGIGASQGGSDGFTDRLVRLDVTDGSTLIWHEAGCYPGEPVYVADPADPVGLGAGVVLSVVLDAAGDSSFLLVLDAADFTELARARVPQIVPFGFHGAFIGR
jgi:beta,beta-carotene 9',10'-dioxygenase